MIALLVIRPEPGNAATVAAARALGLKAEGHPLFAIAPRAWAAPDGPFDAILAGSANAFRHGGAKLDHLRELPVLAVGSSTAEAARHAGFNVAAVGEGGLQGLVDTLAPGHRRLLRLCGEDRVALDLPKGVEVTEALVYASEPLPMPAALRQRLAAPAVVVLHSAEAARHFAAECNAHTIARSAISLAAIGPRVAIAASEGWAACRAAAQPSDPALLALAQALCQTGAPSSNQGPTANDAR